MWKQATKKLSTCGLSQPILYRSFLQHRKVAPVYALIGRHASTRSKNSSSTPVKQKHFNKRFVEVDSPLAKANKLLYALPEDPYFASEKVARILEIGTVEDAADYIMALPIYLQSNVIWNQLIGYCAKFGKSNFAEKYYSQMRKRGIQPNERTITNMLTAYAKSQSPNCIKNAESWFAKLQDLKISPSIIHFNILMRVYNNSGSPEKTIELLKHMKRKGEVIPDAITYTTALMACPHLTQMNQSDELELIWNEIIYRVDKTVRKPNAKKPMSLLSQKALEIIASEKSIGKHSGADAKLELDDSLIVALLTAVGRTVNTGSNALIGVEIIDRFFSLCPRRAAEIMEKNGVELNIRKPGYGIQPSVKVVDSILRLSGNLREYELGVQYYNLIRDQYPRVKFDKQVEDSLSFLEYQLKRRNTKPSPKQRQKKNK